MPDKRPTPPDGLTSIKRRRLKKSFEIMESPARQIAYQHTVFCQTCLPYRDPGSEIRIWERKQGIVSLRVEAGTIRCPQTRSYTDLGLPYGSRPRLILAHLNSEAIKQDSSRIEVEGSLTAFIRRIQNERPPTGTQVCRFKDQLSRLAGAIVRLSIDLSEDRAFQTDTKIIDSFEIWLDTYKRQRVLWPAVVELSPRYFSSLQKHAVPLDERAIGALANSALALDIYSWLAQRLHRIDRGKPQRISWKALYDQFGQGFTRHRAFRARFKEALALVQIHYRGAKIEVDEKGLLLRNSPPPVLCRHSVVRP